MNYSKLKVVDLKKILTERGLATKGLKADLVKRLEEDDLAKQNQNVEQTENSSDNNATFEANVEANNVNPTKESPIIETKPAQEPIIQNSDTTKEIENPEKQNTEEIKHNKSPKKEKETESQVTEKEEIVETLKESKIQDKIKDQSEIKEIEKPISTENDTINDNNSNKENNNSVNNDKEEKNNNDLNKPENKTKDVKNEKIIPEQNKGTDTKSSIPKIEQSKEIDNTTQKEKDSGKTPQIHIVGTSHKDSENADINLKKRTLNTDDNNEESSKRKKIDNSNNASPIDKKPQDTILINNFVRPLITRSVKELVAQYGEVKSFWMDSIKSHAFVTYTSVESAEAACKGINGIKFPIETGKILSVEYISEAESKERIKKEEEKRLTVNISGAGSKSLGSAPIRGRFDSLYASRIGIPIKTGKLSQEGGKKSDTSPFSASPTTISPSSIARAAASQSIKIIGKNKEHPESISISSSQIKEVYASLKVDKAVSSRVSSRFKSSKETTETTEVSFLHNSQDKNKSKESEKTNSDSKSPVKDDKKKKKPSMDDLFKKTKATPTIYYKPLTEEEVKQKEKRENEERIRSRERLKERERESKRSKRY